jgi:hypothetical protein
MNERDISKGFSEVWGRHFPLLTPNFVHVFNEGYVKRIRDSSGVVAPVPLGVDAHHADAVAEFGFHLAAEAHAAAKTVVHASADPKLVERAISGTLRAVRVQRGELAPTVDNLSDSEQNEGVMLARVYERFIGTWPGHPDVEFSPQIPGASFINSCRADLSIGTTLFEIKTVSRTFQSRDIRQLLVYLCLQAATRERRWLHGGLFNPREGLFCRFSVDWLVERLSGGRPPLDVLVGFVSTLSRDAEIEARF